MKTAQTTEHRRDNADRNRVLHATWILGAAAALGAIGCASTGSLNERGEADFSSTTHHAVPSVRVGDAQVVASQVNPQVPQRLTSQGDEVFVSFARPGRFGTVARLDASSLRPLSTDENQAKDGSMVPSSEPQRVVLEHGRFVVLWVRGSAEWGHRALAQAFDTNGSPRGAPVVISPPDVDVVGIPHAISPDGRHVVATFVASRDNSFDVFAVPIDDVALPQSSDAMARR